jgi:hypothetical protein
VLNPMTSNPEGIREHAQMQKSSLFVRASGPQIFVIKAVQINDCRCW